MAEKASEGMIDQLLSAGQTAIAHHLQGKTDLEHEALEFMDSLWDQMPKSVREQALERLRESGLGQFADRIHRERKDLADLG